MNITLQSESRDHSPLYDAAPPLWQKITLALAFLLPAALLAQHIVKYWVDIPYWDQWGYAPILVDAAHGKVTFGELYAQHNESRNLFPNMAFILLAHLTHWDTRAEMCVTFLLAAVTAVFIFRLAAITCEMTFITRLVSVLAGSFLIFSPVQWENWLWGEQFALLIPMLCITGSLLVAYSRLRDAAKFLLCGVLATFATFSFAQGMLCWVIVYPVLAVCCFPSRAGFVAKRALTIGWIFGFVLNLALYFHNYHKAADNGSVFYALRHPRQAVEYFLCFLGAPLGIGTFGDSLPGNLDPIVKATMPLGFILLAAFTTLAAYAYTQRADRTILRKIIGWLMIGAFVILSALIADEGRLKLGAFQSLSSRYTSFSIYLIISLMYLGILLVPRWCVGSSYRAGFAAGIVAWPLAVFPFLLHDTVSASYSSMQARQTTYLHGKALLEFINIAPSPDLTAIVYPDLTQLKSMANEINQIRYLHPGLVKPSQIPALTANGVTGGVFDTLKPLQNGEYLAAGWAAVDGERNSADAVLLSFPRFPGDDQRYLTLLPTEVVPGGNPQMAVEQNSVAIATGNSDLWSGAWETLVPAQWVKQADKPLIRAWAIDARTEQLFPLTLAVPSGSI